MLIQLKMMEMMILLLFKINIHFYFLSIDAFGEGSFASRYICEAMVAWRIINKSLFVLIVVDGCLAISSFRK